MRGIDALEYDGETVSAKPEGKHTFPSVSLLGCRGRRAHSRGAGAESAFQLPIRQDLC